LAKTQKPYDGKKTVSSKNVAGNTGYLHAENLKHIQAYYL
jgi:hypothetical protein